MLYERGYKQRDVRNLFRFIDWLMRLPEELENEFWQEIRQYEEVKRMPYITSVERRAIRKGLEEAIELGLDLKFGEEGLKLMSEIQEIEDIEMLKSIA